MVPGGFASSVGLFYWRGSGKVKFEGSLGVCIGVSMLSGFSAVGPVICTGLGEPGKVHSGILKN